MKGVAVKRKDERKLQDKRKTLPRMDLSLTDGIRTFVSLATPKAKGWLLVLSV